MTEAVKTPWHLWLVGVVSLLWNAFGAYDYTMTNLRNQAYLDSMGYPAEGIAYLDAFPIWAHSGWALGVWGAVIGSVLLLMRSPMVNPSPEQRTNFMPSTPASRAASAT